MPGKRTPERVIVYIDGFNLYYGIRGSGLGRYLWLNLCSFSQKIIKPHQSPALRFPWTLICDKENQDVQHETLGFRARARSPEGD